MVSDTAIKISKPVRDKLYYLKGPDKDYNTVISELVEKEIESRSPPASNGTGTIPHCENEVIN